MVMDSMTDDIREEAPWTMLFADDIVICSESKEQLEETLDSWIYALERRGMKVNRRKTEHMCVNERQVNGTVKKQEEVAKMEDFKYYMLLLLPLQHPLPLTTKTATATTTGIATIGTIIVIIINVIVMFMVISIAILMLVFTVIVIS